MNSAKGFLACTLFQFLDKAHARRYLIDSIHLDTEGKEIPGSKGAEGRGYIDLLFKVEDEIKDLSYEEKKQKRQDASQPILDAFWPWVEETSVMYNVNEKLTQALGYYQNQRKYLETFLKDGRIPLSNNYCEANIKPFATARRAWLFADTPRSAFANGVLYTLVESSRANKLDVYEYLKYLLTEMPNNHYQEDPPVIDHLLPWSEDLPEQCYLKIRRKNASNNDVDNITENPLCFTTPCFEALTKLPQGVPCNRQETC